MKQGGAVAWQHFIAAALLVAITGGFGLGAYLMAAQARATGVSWWEAAAQAHGHLQLFGWAGLMVVGVGLYVLPHLRGAPLAHPSWTRLVWALLGGGLVVRALAQPALAATPAGAMHGPLGAALLASGVLELAGVCLLLWMLGATHAHRPQAGARA